MGEGRGGEKRGGEVRGGEGRGRTRVQHLAQHKLRVRQANKAIKPAQGLPSIPIPSPLAPSLPLSLPSL